MQFGRWPLLILAGISTIAAFLAHDTKEKICCRVAPLSWRRVDLAWAKPLGARVRAREIGAFGGA